MTGSWGPTALVAFVGWATVVVVLLTVLGLVEAVLEVRRWWTTRERKRVA